MIYTTMTRIYGDNRMPTLKHTCDNCENPFKIIYDPEVTTDDPVYCPFCAEYIITEKDDSDDLDISE